MVMRKTPKQFMLLVILGLMQSLLVIGCSGDSAPVVTKDATEAACGEEPGEAGCGLELTAKPLKPEYVIGMPVVFRATVRNVSKKEMEVCNCRHLLNYETASGEDGPWVKLRSASGISNSKPWTKAIGPGETVDFNIYVTLDSRKINSERRNCDPARDVPLRFDRPGGFRFRFLYPDPRWRSDHVGDEHQLIPSAAVRVRIREPKDSDVAVWHEIRCDLDILCLMYSGDVGSPKDPRTEKCVEKAIRILRANPQSEYRELLADGLRTFRNDHRSSDLATRLWDEIEELTSADRSRGAVTIDVSPTKTSER
jgi:hypothetical protein